MEEQQVINSNKSELWNLSLKDLFYKYVRFLPLFLLSVAIALFLAFAYLRYTTKIYSATGSMLIKNEQQSNRSDELEKILEGGNNRSQNILNEIEVIKSRPLMERVVKKLNLEFNYIAKGKIKDDNIYKLGPFIAEAFALTDSTRSFSMKFKFTNDHQFRIDDVFLAWESCSKIPMVSSGSGKGGLLFRAVNILYHGNRQQMFQVAWPVE